MSESGADWPISLSGVTETVVTTLGPNGKWNAAALGLFDGDPATATTWGSTRTRGNFHRQGEGYVQFVDDPVVFADAALSIDEYDDPVLEAACAWTRVDATPIETGTDAGTEWERWELEPVESAVLERTVPTIDRGFGAVIEATVAASRLGIDGYDDDELRNRLEYFADVVDRAGGPRERTALERVRTHSEW
ncbi:hypothetical protein CHINAEXTREME_14695 [Halobiforma lacisalsi AJ5]|uniref:DUF447 domain-containing protein n=1 Tax=Natronobacterium lacisalsi AJ5 TaxID=358396 RepID=M0L5J4_NATLA|nr:DUF447 domain-containing protein [Halobiforma lacisalsi]APW98946.1 hypothetical protein CHINAEXTREME_14695 [Halobiforma lacisalsi AJ5]EMA27260.1 hypothetical protein C445_20740 [Halobiforma lacisalsi AJ5]